MGKKTLPAWISEDISLACFKLMNLKKDFWANKNGHDTHVFSEDSAVQY